nr:hypothetical protein [uncultured Flavobacterium sp.]
MVKKWVFILFLLGASSVSAQLLSNEEVTKSELKQARHEKDTTAPAAFLYKKGQTYFKYYASHGFVSFTEIAVKIKIYKKEGLKWANFEIPFYTGYKALEDEMIDIKKAITYNLENDKIIKEKVKSDGKFKEVINENWSVSKITFPNVKVGSIIEFHYILRTENLSELPDFQCQFDIPVDKVEYTTKIPEFYIYKGIKTGYADIEQNTVLESASQSFNNQYNQMLVMNFKQVKTYYMASDVPALHEEEYVNNIKNYYSKIMHELSIIRMPDEDPKPIATTWNAIAQSIYKEKAFGEELGKFNYFLNDLKLIRKESDSAETKMTSVFNFVKNKMSWDGKYGYYTRKGVEKAYAERTGNVAEVNLILTAMLRLSGLEANPIILSTRDNGVAQFPNTSFLNYVIASVKINGKIYFLDATDKLANINFLPIRALNQYGVLMKKDGTSEEMQLMPKFNSHTVTNILANVSEEGEVTGKIRRQYLEYNAYVFKERNDGFTPESLIEKLEKKHNGLEVSEYTIQNNSDFLKPVVESYSCKTTDDAEVIADRMYVSPFLYFATTENPFKQEQRKYPIDFVFPHQVKFNISFKIPDSYSIEKIPESKALAMPDNLGSMKYNSSMDGNQIQILYTFEINQAIIEPEYYEILKNFYKEVINKQTEKIVLKKV